MYRDWCPGTTQINIQVTNFLFLLVWLLSWFASLFLYQHRGHKQTTQGSGRNLFGSHFHATAGHWGKLGQEFKQEPRGRNRSRDQGGTLLTGLLPVALSATFLLLPRPICPEMVLPTRDWAQLHQLVIKKTPQKCAIWERQLPSGLLSSQVCRIDNQD